MRDMPAHTRPRASAEGQVVLIHCSQLFCGSLLWIPAFRHKFCGVLAKDLLIPVRDPRVDANDGLVYRQHCFPR
jgi:hypothetical protein